MCKKNLCRRRQGGINQQALKPGANRSPLKRAERIARTPALTTVLVRANRPRAGADDNLGAATVFKGVARVVFHDPRPHTSS